MPEVSRAQFLKADPNQQAMPGMENLSHPGAALLSQGYLFDHESQPFQNLNGDSRPGAGSHHFLNVMTPEGHHAGSMSWTEGNEKRVIGSRWGHSPGEISGIEVSSDHQGRGIATAMYGIGRQMARVKPRHSTARTGEGDAWARTTTDRFGGQVPKKNTLI